MKPTLFVLLAAALVVGCQKSGDSADNSSTTPSSTSATPPKAPAAATGSEAKGKYAAVQAIFTANCVKCHGAEKAKAGINLTSYEGVMKGGEEGAIVVAGKPDTSQLVMALHGKGAKQMPPRSALPAADIATIEGWIKDGAKNG